MLSSPWPLFLLFFFFFGGVLQEAKGIYKSVSIVEFLDCMGIKTILVVNTKFGLVLANPRRQSSGFVMFQPLYYSPS